MVNEVKDYLNDYCDFVTKVTSEPSLNQKALFERMEFEEAVQDLNQKSEI